MEYTITSLEPDLLVKVKVASMGFWFQESWSAFSSLVNCVTGGARVIPDDCEDALQGVTLVAVDGGIRLTYGVQEAYEDEVAGIEVCWSVDGVVPVFSGGYPRMLIADRVALLPVSYGTTVKVKIRCVDNAGRHCITPIVETIVAKSYPVDLQTVVGEVQNIKEMVTTGLPGLEWLDGGEIDGGDITEDVTRLVETTVTTAKKGYIYGFDFTSQENCTFTIRWKSNDVNRTQTIEIASENGGTIYFVDTVAMNAGLPADADTDVYVTVSRGEAATPQEPTAGKKYHCRLFYVEALQEKKFSAQGEQPPQQ